MPTKKRPLLAITGPSSFTSEVIRMVETYFEANFVMLYHNSKENILEWEDSLSGVILSGGNDIHPSSYSSSISNRQNFSKFDIDRDIREITMIESCLKNKIPMLGICRGHQLLGIYHGMEIIADITDGDIAHTPHKQGINLNNHEPCHSVRLIGEETMKYFNEQVPKERESVSRIKPNEHKKDVIWVNSYHHQALKYYARGNDRKWDGESVSVHGIASTGIKGNDEIIELMSGRKNPFVSVQWHPELDYETNTPSRKVLEKFNQYMKERHEKI